MSDRDHALIASVNQGDPLAVKFPGFSCPQEGLDETFLDLLATQYAIEITRLFVEKYGMQLRQCSRGLVEVLEGSLNDRAVSEVAWDPALGEAYRAIRYADLGGVAPIAAALALRLGASGVPGQWEATLGGPLQLRWDHWLLPPAEHVTVSCHGDTARIRTRMAHHSYQTASFSRADDRWQGDGAEHLPQLDTQNGSVPLLPRQALMLEGFDELVDAAIDSIEPTMVTILQEAVELLRSHSPIYLSWVQRVLHYMFLIKPKVKHIQSGSIENYLGFVHVSASPKPTALAELLVHEASHQYFYLLCCLGPFDDGTDTRMYYSPAVRTNRPLSRIGVAYHAFANILLFYRLCLDSGIADDRYFAPNIANLTSMVEQLEVPLRGNQALTPIGEALCYPLVERLH